jgi:catechol 2,3-dioxygenase-like lactoylglutathione lyase family enzyme
MRDAQLVAFVAARDLPPARQFYEHILGLRVAGESPFACVFDANGVMLRVTKTDDMRPAPYTVLGWSVADIVSAVRALSERGLEILRYDGMDQDDLGIWTTPTGERVAWFQDPDGNTLSLTQFHGTEYGGL